MAYSTIPKGSLYMNTKLYTGNGKANQAITGVGFQPDWVWIKNRGAANHYLFDAVRGVQKNIHSNENYAEVTEATTLTAFGSDGFTLSTDADINGSGASVVSWNWKANGQGSSNTDGSINTTYTSANTTAGFSICQYTGTGSNATIGHGLGAVPKMIFVKCTSTSSTNWIVYTAATGNTHWMYLNATNAASSNSTAWNNTSPTSSVFSLGNDGDVNGSGRTYIAYAFADKTGYSKVGGSYTGNGSTNGTFVYTGFKPSFVIIKRTSSGGDDWVMYDNKRNTFNVLDKRLNPNSSGAEQDTDILDFLSNGFKLRGTPDYVNGNGSTYIYMAFAENPFVATSGTTAVPVTAR